MAEIVDKVFKFAKPVELKVVNAPVEGIKLPIGVLLILSKLTTTPDMFPPVMFTLLAY